MKVPNTAHQFAFYSEVVSLIRKEAGETYLLTDPDLVYRIIAILRLEKSERIVLFDNRHQVLATIIHIEAKKSVKLKIDEIKPNVPLTPTIHWVLPLLKREAFEEALYTLTELGAQSIHPVTTQKTLRFFGGEREIARWQKILKAASEQSKQFVIPELHPIIPLTGWLSKVHSPTAMKIFFDAQGIPLKETIALVEQKKASEMIVCSGPEGDLTFDEKRLLNEHGFVFSALTKTVLRAQQAVAVGLGAFRSLLS